LKRTLRSGRFELRVNSAFNAVLHACAALAQGRQSTWISAEIIQAYGRLHDLGFAHSVETWRDGRLVGGLYGVAVQGLFAGESMFSAARDSSKAALVYLVHRMRRRNFQLLDIQFMTAHLRRFGAVEIPAAEYKLKLARALMVPARFVEPKKVEEE
jgi:leucyl/phenylalanyl-tRNA--protein transferase